MNRSKGFRQWLGTLVALCVAPLCAAQSGLTTTLDASSFNSGNRWVTTWSAAQQQPGPMTIDAIFGNDQSRSFENQTIRHIVHTSVGGRTRTRAAVERVRLPADCASAPRSVALRRADASIYPGTNRRLTFSGQTSIVIPAGAVAVSDAVDLDVPASGRPRRQCLSTDRDRARDLPREDDVGLLHHRSRAITPGPRICRVRR